MAARPRAGRRRRGGVAAGRGRGPARGDRGAALPAHRRSRWTRPSLPHASAPPTAPPRGGRRPRPARAASLEATVGRVRLVPRPPDRRSGMCSGANCPRRQTPEVAYERCSGGLDPSWVALELSPGGLERDHTCPHVGAFVEDSGGTSPARRRCARGRCCGGLRGVGRDAARRRRTGRHELVDDGRPAARPRRLRRLESAAAMSRYERRRLRRASRGTSPPPPPPPTPPARSRCPTPGQGLHAWFQVTARLDMFVNGARRRHAR